MLWVIFIPCTYCTDLFNLIYLQIFSTYIILCLVKTLLKKYDLLLSFFIIIILYTYLVYLFIYFTNFSADQ